MISSITVGKNEISYTAPILSLWLVSWKKYYYNSFLLIFLKMFFTFVKTGPEKRMVKMKK